MKFLSLIEIETNNHITININEILAIVETKHASYITLTKIYMKYSLEFTVREGYGWIIAKIEQLDQIQMMRKINI